MAHSTKTYPVALYETDQTRIVCPLAMIPIDLWYLVHFCLVGVERDSLLHYQREAHRVGYSDELGTAPLLGTPSHCLIGLPPPWIVLPNGATFIAEAYIRIALRFTQGQRRVAYKKFFAALAEEFPRRGLTPLPRKTVFDKTPGYPYDVFAYYAGHVRKFPINVTNMDFYRVMAEEEIIERVAFSGEHRIDEGLAVFIAQAIELDCKRMEEE